jgi:hypothetical protein
LLRASQSYRSLARTTAAFATAALITGCREFAQRMGPVPQEATAATDGVFGGIATRFDRPVREPKVRSSRRLITRAALTPSAVYDDTSAWLWSPDPRTRAFAFRGIAEPGRYRFTADRSAAPPRRAGEGRHDTRLRNIGEDQFEWDATSEFGIGDITPAALAALPVAWIASGERADSAAHRAGIHADYPRATREWGRVFTLVRFESTPDPASPGVWIQRHVVAFTPERAAATHPKFAKWLRDYVRPMRIRLRLRDARRTWFDFTLSRDTMTVRLRSREGRLLPLEGSLVPMPDTVRLEGDFSTKVGIFRVGFSGLVGQFVSVRRGDERGWDLRFTSEPHWDLPLFAERMIRTPLRRPFQGTGAHFRITATRDAEDPQTLLARRTEIAVQESAILRFIARLANAGVGDYVEGADTETNRWLTAAFGALRDDTHALLRSPRTEPPSR